MMIRLDVYGYFFVNWLYNLIFKVLFFGGLCVFINEIKIVFLGVIVNEW